MKIENIVIDSKVDFFNARIVGIVGSAGSGKTSLMKHLYNFYDGLRFEMLYENKETLECYSKDRRHSEFEYSNKKVALFDGFYESPLKRDNSFMNMVRRQSQNSKAHKIFISAHTYSSPREIEVEEMDNYGDVRRTRRMVADSNTVKGGNELLYASDLVLKIIKADDGLYKLSVLKSRHNNKSAPLTPFFKTLADEYSKYPVYPNRLLRQHLLKYDKMDMSILPMDNFKDIFNI